MSQITNYLSLFVRKRVRVIKDCRHEDRDPLSNDSLPKIAETDPNQKPGTQYRSTTWVAGA